MSNLNNAEVIKLDKSSNSQNIINSPEVTSKKEDLESKIMFILKSFEKLKSRLGVESKDIALSTKEISKIIKSDKIPIITGCDNHSHLKRDKIIPQTLQVNDETIIPKTVQVNDAKIIPKTLPLNDAKIIPKTLPLNDAKIIPKTLPLNGAKIIPKTLPLNDVSIIPKTLQVNSANLQLQNINLQNNQSIYNTDLLQYKGNILQYKGNSSRLTKKQKYAQISKGFWCNRTKVFATQSQTYTNPNTSSLARVNYTSVPFPNQIVGSPNNISGPFQYGIPNPFDCSTNTIQDGGSLLCGSYSNPCTGEITQTVSEQQCFPTYCSDVPGQIMNLCWNPRLQTFFPRQRTTMNNSFNKWPQGYKGFQSAITPYPPVLTLNATNNSSVILSWTFNNNICIPISSFNIYQNGILILKIPFPLTSAIINLQNNVINTFYVTSVSTNIESTPSNEESYPLYVISNTLDYNYYNYNGYIGLVLNSGSGIFQTSKNINNFTLIVVSGGGGGGGGNSAGGGGGVTFIQNIILTPAIYNISIGEGGNGGEDYIDDGGPGGNSSFGNYISYGGGGGKTGANGGLSGNGGNINSQYGGGGGGGAGVGGGNSGNGGTNSLGQNVGSAGTYIYANGGQGGTSYYDGVINQITLPFIINNPTLYPGAGGGCGTNSSTSNGYGGSAGGVVGGLSNTQTPAPGNGENGNSSITTGIFGAGGGGLGIVNTYPNAGTGIAGSGGNGVVIMYWKQ